MSVLPILYGPKALAIVGSNSQHQHLETRAGNEIRQAGAGKEWGGTKSPTRDQVSPVAERGTAVGMHLGMRLNLRRSYECLNLLL